MEQYLRRNRLRSLVDELGVRMLILMGATGWFVWLWGLGMPALLAGAALSLMGQMALSSYRIQAVKRREEALRRRIGGEMLMEEMMLLPSRKQHLQAAELISRRYPLVLERVEEEGVVCRCQGKRLLVMAVCSPEDEQVTQDAVLQLQRGCRKYTAERGVMCLNCALGQKAQLLAERMPVPVRFIDRERMLTLAGEASPATDEQLLALKRRKKRFPNGKSVLEMLLHRRKAGRYMFYGVAMLVIRILTGWVWYGAMGLALVIMASAGRWINRETEEL